MHAMSRARLELRFAWTAFALVAAASACSAILGIDAIPPAGDFPIDGGGKTCAELQADVDSYCGPAAASKGVPPSECTIVCGSENGSMASCICGTDGSLPDGFTGPDVVPTEGGMGDTMTSSDTPAPPTDGCSQGCMKDAPLDNVVPADSPEEFEQDDSGG